MKCCLVIVVVMVVIRDQNLKFDIQDSTFEMPRPKGAVLLR